MKTEHMISRLSAFLLTTAASVGLLIAPIAVTHAATVVPSPSNSAETLIDEIHGTNPTPTVSASPSSPKKEDTGLQQLDPIKEDTSVSSTPNSTNPYAQLGPNGFDTRPAAPPAFTVPVYPSIESYVVMVINFLLDFLALGVLTMFVYGGFMYTTAMGDSGKQKKARGIITSSIVGFFLVVISFALVATIIAATRPGVNECATPQSGVCISSSGGNVNFGVGAGVGSLLSNIF